MLLKPEIISLLGTPHYAAPAEGDALAKLMVELEEAENGLTDHPNDPNMHVMVGRRLAYLWRYHESIAAYTQAISHFPSFAPLYRHRGHRYISIRRFGPAAKDLTIANDLQPNDFDILYHLGLSRWLQGDYEGARIAYESYLPMCTDDDQRIPLTYWLYMTLRRLDLDQAAELLLETSGTPTIKDDSVYYFNVLRLFMGVIEEAEAIQLMTENDLAAGTIGYGIGLWHLFHQRPSEAMRMFDTVLTGKYWPAFGFIAAEVEKARLEKLL